MARKNSTLIQREKARRVRRSKARRQREKQDFTVFLETVDLEETEYLQELAEQELFEQEEQRALEAQYRKRQLVIEFGPEKAEEIDWGERALESYCEASLSPR